MIPTTLRLLTTARILAAKSQTAARRTAAGAVADTGTTDRWVDNHLLVGHDVPSPVPQPMPEPLSLQGQRFPFGGGGSPGSLPGGRYRTASQFRGSSPRNPRTVCVKRPNAVPLTKPVSVCVVPASCGAAAVKV